MNTKYTATLIKSGNSYALRLPKWVVEASGLKVGDKVDATTLPVAARPTLNSPAQRQAILDAFRALQEATARAKAEGKGLGMIEDPIAWQREIRNLDKPLPGRDY